MPINVFRNSSTNSEHEISTSIFVQKPYLRANYVESNTEEVIDLKNQYRIKILPDPISIGEAASKNYVDGKFIDPSIKKTPLMLTSMIKVSIVFTLLEKTHFPPLKNN